MADGLGKSSGGRRFLQSGRGAQSQLSKAPYIARLMWHQIIPLGSKKVVAEREPFSLFQELPERRLEIRFGKMSLADFFDVNTYGTDSNFQFMNWTVDNNGAYDYAADTRGFTFAAMFEYHDAHLLVRFAEALMPKVANGIHLDADLAQRPRRKHRTGTARPCCCGTARYVARAHICEPRQHGRLHAADQ